LNVLIWINAPSSQTERRNLVTSLRYIKS